MGNKPVPTIVVAFHEGDFIFVRWLPYMYEFMFHCFFYLLWLVPKAV